MDTKKKLVVYLAGAMEQAEDLGAGWRTAITPFLEKLNLDILNPCEFEPLQLKGLQPNRLPEYFTNINGERIKPRHWHELKNAQESSLYNRFLKYMKRIIQYDIKMIRHQVDCVVVYWTKDTAKGAGTHAELTEAFLRNIPVYCVANTDVPAWTKACCTEIFLTFDDLKKFLIDEFEYIEDVEDTKNEQS